MEPGIIRRLDEVVVNRIAAGEIIKRPANALKEMIENSLDAKSTTITITVKDGGLKLLQIQDNGTGIRKVDLEIICERFTTSKLQTFEDLSSMSTYGFRGEALASISHVAHLSIQTKIAGATCAYKANYSDSKLVGAVKAVAGNQGTLITVEDLFYNVPQRKQALKSFSEEFHLISDVVSKYAVHNTHVGFSLKKMGDKNSVRTVANSTQRQNITAIYGVNISKDLLDLHLDDALLRMKMRGCLTNVNYSSKKSTILLFINHRLVESANLKVAIDEIYGIYLPKGAHPFVYMSVELDANTVDVNVHPTKHEVHFLHEEEICTAIKSCIERTLLGSNEARTFYSQTLLPGASEPKPDAGKSQGKTTKQLDAGKESVNAKDLVRTDSKTQKLEKFFGNTTLMSTTLNQTKLGGDSEVDCTQRTIVVAQKNMMRSRKSGSTRKQTKLTSILRLRKRCEDDCHPELRDIVNDLIFIGAVDRKKALIQHDTKMYLCDTQSLSEQLFYQLLLYDFENFGAIRFKAPGLSLRTLAELALQSPESGWTIDDGPIDELSQSVVDICVQHAAMLREYYNFDISIGGYLLQIPMLLDNHKPSLAHLPMYILRLATEVDWDSEASFFESFTRETASFYSCIAHGDATADQDVVTNVNTVVLSEASWKWHVEHVLYAAMKEYLLPSKACWHNQSFLVIANLPNLYRVFERC